MLDAGDLGQDRLGLFIDALALASSSTQTRSASCAPLQAVETMARSSRRLGRKMPGVSTRMICDNVLDDDAADQRARGLHLARDDGDLGPDQRIDQRGLADIGRADQRDETAARGTRAPRFVQPSLPPPTPSRSIITEAATFSAARLLPPMAFADASPGRSTATRKCGS